MDRYSPADSELRADRESRIVRGVAVRYEEVAPNFRELFRAGSLTVPDPPPNATVQHDRAMPVGRPAFTDSPEALRFEVRVADGARGDQLLADIDAQLVRGASVGFKAAWGGEHRDAGGRRVITKARLTDLGFVDKPAYPSSSIEHREDRLRAIPRWWL